MGWTNVWQKTKKELGFPDRKEKKDEDRKLSNGPYHWANPESFHTIGSSNITSGQITSSKISDDSSWTTTSGQPGQWQKSTSTDRWWQPPDTVTDPPWQGKGARYTYTYPEHTVEQMESEANVLEERVKELREAIERVKERERLEALANYEECPRCEEQTLHKESEDYLCEGCRGF